MLEKRRSFGNLLLYILIAITLYFVQRISVFQFATPELPFAFDREFILQEYIILFLIIVGISIWYFLREKKYGDFKFHFPLAVVLTALFIVSFVSILTFPSIFNFKIPTFTKYDEGDSVIYVVNYYKYATIFTSPEQKILYILVSACTMYLIYLIIWVLPRKIRYSGHINSIVYCILFLAIISIIFSYINDFDYYVVFFTDINRFFGENVYLSKSFYNHKNTFGMALTFGVFSSLYLFHTTRKWWFLPLSAYIAFHTITCGSKTNALISFIAIGIYFVATLIINFKKHKASGFIFGGILVTILVAYLSLIIIHQINNNFMNELYEAVIELQDHFIGGAINNQNDFTGRTVHYIKAEQLLNLGYWVTGLGYGLFGSVFLGMENISRMEDLYFWDSNSIMSIDSIVGTASESPHSAYYQMLGSGGYISLVVYALIVLYVLYAMVRIFKKHTDLVVLSFTVLFTSILHGFMEAATIIYMNPPQPDSFGFTLFAIIPVLSAYYHDKHPSENRIYIEDCKQFVSVKKEIDKKYIISKSIYFFLVPVIVPVCVILPLLFSPTLPNHIPLLITMIVLAVTFVFVPALIEFIIHKKAFKLVGFIFDIFIPYLMECLSFALFIYVYSIIFPKTTTTEAMLLEWVVILVHAFLFTTFKSFKNRAGIITVIVNGLTSFVAKIHIKRIVVQEKEDKFTIEERIFNKLTPRRLRFNGRENNQANS